MKIIFIRHGKTLGNLEKRYIGITDESLCREGREELSLYGYPNVEVVVCSPMKRCTETAQIIYSDKTPVIYTDLSECDFGDFEGKNYIELSENPAYQRWIDSGGKISFPNGEAHEDFKNRCKKAFTKAVSDFVGCSSVAFVVHGGTIMAILESYAVPKKSFYDYQIKNGCGYITNFENGKIEIVEEIV